MRDVVVIGAGLAGAAAALRLGDAGRKVTVIEARHRTGGRTYSRPMEGLDDLLEFGGSWITDWHDRMKAHVARFGLGLRPTLPITDRRWHDGQTLRTDAPVAADNLATFTAGMEAFRQDSLAMQNSAGRWQGSSPWAGKSFADYMQIRGLPESVRHELMAWWTISGSAEITEVNALDMLFFASHRGGTMDGMLSVLSHTIEGGVGTLADRMVAGSGAELILGDAVVEVADRGEAVALRLSSGALVMARHVVVATPVNALGTMRFDPALRPAQARLASEKHRGRAIKVLMRVQGVAPGALATGEACGLRLMFAERALSDGSTAVIAFGLADEVTDTSPAAMDRALRRFFPEARLVAHDWHDWLRDPWSSGTWVSHGLGQSPLFAGPEWAPKGRLSFATSDIASRESGWFEGAVLAGESAAEAILAGPAA